MPNTPSLCVHEFEAHIEFVLTRNALTTKGPRKTDVFFSTIKYVVNRSLSMVEHNQRCEFVRSRSKWHALAIQVVLLVYFIF